MSEIDWEYNPLSGKLEIIDKQDHHGGFHYIPSGRTAVIENYKNMVVHHNQTIDGTLIIQADGLLSIIG